MALAVGQILLLCVAALLCAWGVPRLGDALLARRGFALAGADARVLLVPAQGANAPKRARRGRMGQGLPSPAQGASASARPQACPAMRAAACARAVSVLAYGLLLAAGGAGVLAYALCITAFLVLHVAVYCDCMARIIPTELAVALACCGLCLCMANGGLAVLCGRLAAALFVLGILCLCNLASRLRHAQPAFGGGDLKTLPPLALFGGVEALLAGMLACSLITACVGTSFALARRKLRGTHVPLAPGMLVCLFVTTLGT